MKQIYEYLSAKVKIESYAPFQHWKQAWWKFHHNQYKFNHEIEQWHNGEIKFNIKIWKDEKLVVAYKYCLNHRYKEECKKLEEEAFNRGWDMTSIDFNTRTWNQYSSK